MNYYRLFIFFFFIVFVTCKSQISKTKTNKTQTNSGSNFSKFEISGKVTHSFKYCGGAPPSPEMLKEATALIPYVGKTFYIRKGKINTLKQKIILSFKADTTGRFSFKLPAGSYIIIQEAQVKQINVKKYKNMENVLAEDDCLKQWWAKPYFILDVKDKNIDTLDFKFFHPCFISEDIPCLQYTGPLPQ